jgi:GntR family transcriptional regulator of arabinose operon
VLVDRYLRGIQCASVQSDNVAGARQLVAELVEAGHRHICAMVYPPQDTSTIEDRVEGYMQALADAGILPGRSLIFTEEQFDVRADGGTIPEVQVTRFVAFLLDHPEVTAVFATNTALALLAWRAAEQLHWRIPEDLSVVTIDALGTVPYTEPLFTCGRQQGYEMGTAAVELLLEQLAGQQPRRVMLPMQLHRSGSIGPPRVGPLQDRGAVAGQ